MSKQSRIKKITYLQVLLGVITSGLFVLGVLCIYGEFVSGGVFSFLGGIGLAFLIRFLGNRKITPEEKAFKGDVIGLTNLKKRGLISKEEFREKKIEFFKNFLNAFSKNRKRTFEYKIETLAEFKESGIISEGEFDEGKAKLIEELK